VTNPTQFATALRGLVEAAQGLVDACDRGADVEVMGRSLARVRASLAAWERRGTAADNAKVTSALYYAMHERGFDPSHGEVRDLIEVVDRALTGEREP